MVDRTLQTKLFKAFAPLEPHFALRSEEAWTLHQGRQAGEPRIARLDGGAKALQVGTIRHLEMVGPDRPAEVGERGIVPEVKVDGLQTLRQSSHLKAAVDCQVHQTQVVGKVWDETPPQPLLERPGVTERRVSAGPEAWLHRPGVDSQS